MHLSFLFCSINKIKYFLINLDYLIAKSFFYYQCKFKDIIVDIVQSLLRNQKIDFDIAGFTCIEGDYLSKSVPFKINEGDFIRYDNVGSYSIVMKPPFILPAPPVLQCEFGVFKVIKTRESNANVFERFVF